MILEFFLGGSVCTCNDRMYLHGKIRDEFMEKFVAEVKAQKVGNPTSEATQVGPRPVSSSATTHTIMRCVKELAFEKIYIHRAPGESPNGFHTGYRKSGLGSEDGPHGIEGFVRKRTVHNSFP